LPKQKLQAFNDVVKTPAVMAKKAAGPLQAKKSITKKRTVAAVVDSDNAATTSILEKSTGTVVIEVMIFLSPHV